METACLLATGARAATGAGDWFAIAVAVAALVSVVCVFVAGTDESVLACRSWTRSATMLAMVALLWPELAPLGHQVRLLLAVAAVDGWLACALCARTAIPRAVLAPPGGLIGSRRRG